jgi:hypothetical protein
MLEILTTEQLSVFAYLACSPSQHFENRIFLPLNPEFALSTKTNIVQQRQALPESIVVLLSRFRELE